MTRPEPSGRPAKRTTAAVVCVVCTLVSACHGRAEAPVLPRPVLAVELVSARHEVWADRLSASGEVAPWQEASIGAEVAGLRLEEVLVNVGDVVRKGQLLARYNDAGLRAELARLDAAVAEADAKLSKADADETRAESMVALGAMSRQALLTYHTQAAVAKAELAAVHAQRDAQVLTVHYARVIAPDDGLISSRSATVGAVGTVGTELFRLVCRRRLEWRAEVPADAMHRLTPGMDVSVQALSGAEIKGVLRQLSPIVNSGTRNGLAYVDLPQASDLAAGMYLSGQFLLPARDTTTIPESAIVLRDGNRYLMKVDAQNQVHEIKVETGRRQRDYIELLDDVDPSARFVKSGGAFLGDGDLVHLVALGASSS